MSSQPAPDRSALPSRLRRLLELADEYGLSVEQSVHTRDCYRIILDGPLRQQMLTCYGEPNNSVEVFWIDDDRGEYHPITQKLAREEITRA